MMDEGEVLWPLSSVNSFITEELIVYPMDEKGVPIIEEQFSIGEVASSWMARLDKDDDTLVSEMIYWYEN